MKICLLAIGICITLFASAYAPAATISLSGADYVPLLDQPARSCAAQMKNWNDQENFDIPGVVALMGTVRMSWEGPGLLYLDSMVISFTGENIQQGNSDIIITGEELGFLWSNDNVIPTFKPFTDRSVTPFCRFRVGPVNVVDKYKYFEAMGTITVTGHYLEAGLQKSISGQMEFGYHMSPMPRP